MGRAARLEVQAAGQSDEEEADVIDISQVGLHETGGVLPVGLRKGVEPAMTSLGADAASDCWHLAGQRRQTNGTLAVHLT